MFHQHQYINGYLPAGIAHLDPCLSNMNRNHLSHPEQIQSSHQGRMESFLIEQMHISSQGIIISAGKISCWRKIGKSFVVTCNPSCWPNYFPHYEPESDQIFQLLSMTMRFVEINRSNKTICNQSKSYWVLQI